MGGYFTDAGMFLVETLFGLYILAVLLRFLLQVVRADFYNPLAQFLVALTNPPLKPLRRLIPGLFGIDFASVVLLLLLEAARVVLLAVLAGAPLRPEVIAFNSIADLLQVTLNVYLFAILIRVVLSWLNPYPNPASQLLIRLTEPLLRPARRLLPPFSGVDFSPMAVMLALVLVQMLVLRPLLHYGALLAR